MNGWPTVTPIRHKNFKNKIQGLKKNGPKKFKKYMSHVKGVKV